MTVTLRGVGERLRVRRPAEDPERGPRVRRQVGRWYGGLASMVLGVLLLAVAGAAMGPRWDPQPLTDPIDVTVRDTAIRGAPAPRHYETRTTVLTVDLDGATVRARLVEPIGAGPAVPGVVFVHGAGTGQFVGAFVDQAQRFAEAGIATLVPDKRLDTYSTRYRDYVAMAADYARSVAVLRSRPGVDPQRVGVYAESEGGWIAPVMAAADPDLAFVVLISAPVVPPRQQGAFAAEQYLRNTDVPNSVFRAIPRAAGMSLPGGGLDYVDFDVRPYLAVLGQPMLVVYGTSDASMPIVQGVHEILAAARDAENPAVTVRYYEGADHGLRVDKQVLPRFMDEVAGWIRGLPRTGTSGPQIAGAQPSQLYRASPVPQPRWLASGDLMLGVLITGASLIAAPWVAVFLDRVVRAPHMARRGRRRPGEPVPRGPRWAQGIAWRLAGVGFGAVATVVALVWYLVAIARIAMDYQHNAVIVQGGWLLVRLLGLWIVVAAVLLGRRMADVRAAGARVAPGALRLVATWSLGLGTLTLLVVLAYWGVFQLGI